MPEVPTVPGLTGARGVNNTVGVDDVFAADGLLARAMPSFEPREGQLEMARAVARVFQEGGTLIAEAGTGTGKTLAYLVPAILSRERVLVSTGTKNLQEQIYFKDIPALREALGIPFTATCMKGRANYLCLHRLDQMNEAEELALGTTRSLGGDVFLPMVQRWAKTTETGDRAELEDLPEDLPFWNDVAATAETCLGAECPRYDDCFVTRMRQRAAESDVVIVNHHLLCADAAVRKSAYGEVIPACSRVILDEAHQIEDVATQYFGVGVSNHRIEDLARDLEALAATAIADRHTHRELEQGIGRLRDRARDFFNDLAYAHRSDGRAKSEERLRASADSLAQAGDAAAHLRGALDILESTLAQAPLKRGPTEYATTDDDETTGGRDDDETTSGRDDDETTSRRDDETTDTTEVVAALIRRCGEIRDELKFLVRADDPDYVFFVEFRGRGIFLRASPIDVSAIMREMIFDRMTTTVLTSATLAVDGTFDYVRSRLGLARAREVRLASEFDFSQQAILYLPPRMPDPRSSDFSLAAGRQVVEILKRTEGRAFVLFTSYATMREVLALTEMAVSYPIFTQGTAPRSQLLKQFRETPHAVLFATSSFWQGVDVVGEALSCVIIDKIPFTSPGDPITSARIDAIRQRGGDAFGEYQVPLAILSLQQGLGRLIRHRQDRGVLAILDPRLKTKGYGRRFIASLPPAPVVHDLSRVGAFFSRQPRSA